MKWYTVEEDFLNYLRSIERRIPWMNYGNDKYKPFFGELFTIGDLVYITQISHPRKRHSKLKENLDFIKLYDKQRLIAVVNLNYMFPVHKSYLYVVEYRNIEKFRSFKNDIEKNKYIALLEKEMKEMRSKDVPNRALDLYQRKYDYPTDQISLRCFDFKLLEQKCLEHEYKKLTENIIKEVAVTKEQNH